MKDVEFVSYFSLVLGVLLVITATVFLIANILSAGFDDMDDAMVEATNLRIAEVGHLNIGTVSAATAEVSASTSQVSAPMTPAKTYQAVCQACHLSGVLQSPKLTDKAEWQKRMQNGVEALYTSAIQGKGSMPPKGGRLDLSDDTIKQSVDYMLEQAGVK